MKVIATNKRAFFDYFVSDTFEAGICLEGSEVKSVRDGGISLAEAYVQVKDGEIFLVNAYIKPYEKATSYAPDSRRQRKLLLHKSEIEKLIQKTREKSFVLVPIKVYFTGKNLVKLEIGLGKGKKLYDKRETLKEKAIDREVQQDIKRTVAN